MGVDLFFVISGFLITSILLRSHKNSKVFFKHFYVRRVLRIVPIYFPILLVFFVLVFAFDQQNRFTYYKQNWWYYFLFFQNWLFTLKGLPQESYLNHFWSLAVEEQFYLMFPSLVYFFKKENLVKIILAALPTIFVLRAIVWYFNKEDFPAYYCNTFTRIDSILFGCLLGCGYRIKKTFVSIILLVSCLAVLLAGIFYYQSALFKNPLIATAGYSLIALVNYILLSYFTINNSTLPFLRRNLVLNYVGKISYGVYLIHVPVYLIVTSLCTKFLASYATEFVIGTLSIVATILLSSLSYFTLESYFLSLKVYFPVNPMLSKKEASLTERVKRDNIS